MNEPVRREPDLPRRSCRGPHDGDCLRYPRSRPDLPFPCNRAIPHARLVQARISGLAWPEPCHQVPPLARLVLPPGAELAAARPLPAVRPASGRRLDLAVRLQAQAKPVVAQPEAMLADSFSWKCLAVIARLEHSTRITSTGARRAETRGAGRTNPRHPRPHSAPASAGVRSDMPDLRGLGLAITARRHPRPHCSVRRNSSRFGGNLKPDRSSA